MLMFFKFFLQEMYHLLTEIISTLELKLSLPNTHVYIYSGEGIFQLRKVNICKTGSLEEKYFRQNFSVFEE